MNLSIERYELSTVPAVVDFNRRLNDRGVEYRFPEQPESSWLPPGPGRAVFEEYYVARDGDAVRGGYVLKHQTFALGGKLVPVGNFRFPLSEGIIDRTFAAVGVRFLRHALRQQPLLYSLGFGGYQEDIARMLTAAGFKLTDVPFYFKVLRAAAFLRNIRALRTSRARGAALDLLAATGLGAVGLFAADHLVRRTRVPSAETISWERVPDFGPWADDVWRRSFERYATLALRDAATLNALYPTSDGRFIRLCVKDHGAVAGWAVLLDTRMRDSKYFGDMRVASLVDCLAPPDAAERVTYAALACAREAGADLLVTNQGHRVFGAALRRAGFVGGPSNFLLALSPALAREVDAQDPRREEVHVNRGDGDGPVHL